MVNILASLYGTLASAVALMWTYNTSLGWTIVLSIFGLANFFMLLYQLDKRSHN